MKYKTFLTILIISSVPFLVAPIFSKDKIIDVRYNDLTKDARKQVDCLTDNIYYEAGHEPYKGKIAVAQVTLNRVNDGRFGRDVCSVVKQKTKTEHKVVCQFSWYCENKKKKDLESYEQAREVALYVYANYEKLKDFTHGALFYHADYVRPNWRGLRKTTEIGRHIFYKEI